MHSSAALSREGGCKWQQAWVSADGIGKGTGGPFMHAI